MQRLWNHLFEFDRPETPGYVLFVRVFEAFVVVASLYLAWRWGLYIIRLSDVVLELGIANYVDVKPMLGTPTGLILASVMTLLCLAGFLRLFKWAYFTAALLLIVQFSIRFSQGEIPHSSNMTGMALLGFGIANIAFNNPTARRKFALGFVYFFLGLGYSLAGICKVVATGLTWSSGTHLWIWIAEKNIDHMSKFGDDSLNWIQALAVSDHLVATAFLTFGLITELFAFLVWWRPFRKPVLLAVFALHIGIFLTMKIMFWLAVFEVILLLLPLPAVFDRVLRSENGNSRVFSRFAGTR